MTIRNVHLTIAALVLACLAAPLAFAQPAADGKSGQPVVLACTREIYPGFRETVTLDIAAGTVAMATIAPIPGHGTQRSDFPPGTVTRVTDQQVTWVIPESVSNARITYVLNRYTLDLHSSGNAFGSNPPLPFAYDDVCQKQEQKI